MNENKIDEAIELLKKVSQNNEKSTTFKTVMDALALIESAKAEQPEGEILDKETICAIVHKAYCDTRIKQGKEPYWTGGDYNKLDEATKDLDRATVDAVLKAIHFDRLGAQQQEIERLEILSDAYEEKTERLDAEIDRLTAKLDAQQKEIERLKAENDRFREEDGWKDRKSVV